MMATMILATLALFPASGDPEAEFDVMSFLADPQESEAPPDQTVEESDGGFVDFSGLEAKTWAGMVMYSEDFESDPMPAGGLVLRAPMPWLSPADDPEGDYFGLFVHFTGTRLDRDLDFLEKASGTVFLFGVGIDYLLSESPSMNLRAQLGIQYEMFGDVWDTDDGFATVLGLAGSLRLGSGVQLSITPQAYIADAGDWISALQFGLTFKF